MEIRKGKMTIVRKYGLTLLLAAIIGSVLIMATTDAGIVDTFSALIKGAFVGKKNIGTTLANFTTLFLNGIAFAVAAKAGFFNVGIDGDMIIGAMVAAIVGVTFSEMPRIPLLIFCILAACLAGAIWSLVPAILNIKLNANVILVSIMMNSIATHLTSYLATGPFSSGGALPQTKPVGAMLTRLMEPSRLSTGFIMAIILYLAIMWVMKNTKFGFKVKTVGDNAHHAKFAGINVNKTSVQIMMLSGAIAGLAGAIEVLGGYGYYLNNFAAGLGSRGLLVALLVNSNILLMPIAAFFISALSSGSLMMQTMVSVPKDLADTLTSLFIVLASMDMLFMYKRKRKNKEVENIGDDPSDLVKEIGDDAK